MNIKRTILLMFTLRATMLGAGCGRAGEGEHCDNEDGACSGAAPNCDDGLYCAQGGICQPCDTNDCEPTASTAPTSTSSPPNAGCSVIVDAAACGRDDEQLLYCDPAGGGPTFASDCRELGSSNTFCCPIAQACEICDAGKDASNSSDAEVSDEDAGDE